MRVYELDLDFILGSITFDNVDDLLDEIKLHLEDAEKEGHLMSIGIREMTEEEFENIPEFEGY